ncbi:PREDICTED: uncharacterized protein LOC109146973 [Ipomoea nil]|uniref:uncharacterized protein LOC109146973 n=1 Tax=Ipomoea nil TaxID=35883 RepID=UPI000901473A|nr:PREDICTED: uncharacterized protein LOC109146973 [Ipomoea nil]
MGGVYVLGGDWLPDAGNRKVLTELPPQLAEARVCGLMQTRRREWDGAVVRDVLSERDARLVLTIPLSTQERRDSLYWMAEKRGRFTVRSCYRELVGEYEGDGWMGWTKRLLANAEALRNRWVECSRICPLCDEEEETSVHVFFTCRVAQRCWAKVRVEFAGDVRQSIQTAFQYMFSVMDADRLGFALIVCWSLWQCRNGAVWRGEAVTED